MRRERSRLEVLYSISRRLASVHDTDELLSLIVREAAGLLGADAAGIRLLEGEDLVLRARTESAAAIMLRPRLERGESLGGLAVSTGEMIAVEDLAEDPRYDPLHRQNALAAGFRSLLVYPLTARGRTIGVLNLYTKARRRFAPEEVSLVGAFADQASLAIEQANRTTRLRTLGRLSQLLLSSLDTRQVLGEIARAAATLMAAPVVSIWTVNEATGTAEAGAFSDEAIGADFPVKSVAVGAGLIGTVVSTRRPLEIRDAIEDGRSSAPDWWRRHGLTSFYGAPIVHEDALVGVLALNARSPFRLGPDDQDLLDSFMALAALAIWNARLFDESERRRRTAEALAEVGRVLSQELDPEIIGRRIADSVRALLSARISTVFRLEPGSGVLVAIAVSRESGVSSLQGAVFPPGTGGAALAVTERRALAIADLLTDPRIVLTPAIRARVGQEKHRAVLALPLLARGRVIGALTVRDRAGRVFDAEDLRVAQAFADQAALTLENAGLYAEAERRRREAEVMADLARDVNASLQIDAVLQRVADGARELCGSDMSMIALRDPDREAMAVRYRAGAIVDEYTDRRVEPGKGVGGQVLLTGQPFRTDNYAEDPRITKDYLAWARREASVASVAVPIRIGERIEGLLYAQNRSPRPFTERDEAVLLRLGAQAAIAIGNARLFAREQAARAEAEASAEALRATEEQYRVVVEASIQGMYVNRDRIIRFVNRSMTRMFGYDSPDELIGRDYLIFIAPQAHARIEEYRLARLRGEPAPTQYEIEGIRQDGTIIWIQVLVSMVPWEGRPSLLATFLDITERRLAEEALRRSQEQNALLFHEAENRKIQLEQVFASTSDGILVLDLDGRITALNHQGGDFLGVAPDGVVGRAFTALVDRMDDPRVWETAGGQALVAVAGGRGEPGAADLELPFPRARTLRWQALPTRDSFGAVVGLTVTFQDVTQEREVSRMKSDFVAFVTHQLRTPLAGIKWTLELAAGGSDSGEVGTYIEDAREAADRLVGLVNDLLDVSRLEGGQMRLKPEETSLGELTRSVLDEVGGLLREKGHRLSLDGADAIPPVLVDPQLLRQVILNLVGNAIKYTSAGGDIRVRMRRDDGEVRWEIQDSGIGIPREGQRRLFEKFYRADNVRSVETEGTGLGLYIVRLIVERCGGRVWCESEEDKGSTFLFTLPLAA